jgi:hypothetical protein
MACCPPPERTKGTTLHHCRRSRQQAAVVLVDCANPYMTPIHAPVSPTVHSALGHEVTTVLIHG